MRLISILFSVYMMLLVALPCAEMAEKDHSNNAPISQSSENHDDCNDCSPFCFCNCCASPMICHVEAIDLQVSIIARKQETSYPRLSITQRSGDIWQPPQLS